jgi:pimeloyl-ACP methyl ester carboxylesterase
MRTVAAMPLRPLRPRSSFDSDGRHQTPVVFVHGFFGDPTNFVRLQAHLHEQGIRNWSTFAYGPRLDYPRVAPHLLDTIEALRRETGAAQVDVVAHSLGGLIARYLVETGHGDKVRRLVTLGAPWFTHPNPAQELAIFGGDDALVAARARDRARRDRILVVRDCGHLGLLFHPRVLQSVANYLTRPAQTPRVRALAA